MELSRRLTRLDAKLRRFVQAGLAETVDRWRASMSREQSRVFDAIQRRYKGNSIDLMTAVKEAVRLGYLPPLPACMGFPGIRGREGTQDGESPTGDAAARPAADG